MSFDVYRHFDNAGVLLYVGASSSTERRSSEHRSRTPWWSEVARTETQQFRDKSEALAAETAAIKTERPKYNVTHNGWKCSLEKQHEIEARLRAASPSSRKAAIMQARREGHSLREIAAIIGLTHAGIRNIIKQENNA